LRHALFHVPSGDFLSAGPRWCAYRNPFFLWVGIFNVLVVAQFWGFANDLYTEPEGKRLFSIVGVGASLLAWAIYREHKRLLPREDTEPVEQVG